MPVEFLSDEQAAAHGRYAGPPSRVELERYFYLDDADKALIARRRGDHNRLGFALQAVTVRFIGTFLTDPLDVPAEVLDYVAEQLGIADPSCARRYTEREKTRMEHAWEIQREYGLRDFADAEQELAEWIDARAWTTGDGPKAIFDGAVGWLRDRRVLLPGATTLARLVSRVRGAAAQQLWETLHAMLTPGQRVMLDILLEVPDGSRVSEWDRLRKGPRKASGPGMVKALNRVSELAGLRLGELDLAVVPPRRVAELARYGLAGKTPALKRHQDERRLATLLASVHHLEHVATDDALELLDLLVVTDLLARAARETGKERLRRYGSLSRASAKLAAAVEVLLEATGFGEELTLEQLWESIEAVVPRRELADAVAAVTDIAPPPDADPDGEWRAELTKRIATVRGFLPLLCEVIAFGATAEGEPALAAMKGLPGVLAFRSGKLKAGEIPARMVDEGLVTSEWRRLVFRPGASEKAADRAAYVFCVLEKFHRHLRRRDIYAETSTRWRDPRAQLLDGEAWQQAKGPALTALGLPENPDALLASHARRLDATYREVAGRLVVNTDVRVDADGKLHVAHIEAVPDPASLTDLRNRLQAMLPKVDLPELILEVMAWHPAFTDAFTAVSGGESRLADLNVSVAAVLTSHALNVGYAPIIAPGVPTLERDRLSHVDQLHAGRDVQDRQRRADRGPGRNRAGP